MEDNRGDARLVREMLQDTGVPADIDVVTDGDQALRSLRRAMTDHSLPHLVLLDLNLPKRSRHEVLEFIRNKTETADVCVVVYTGSELPEDMDRATRNKANGYLIKPMSPEQMEETTRKFRDFMTSVDACSSKSYG